MNHGYCFKSQSSNRIVFVGDLMSRFGHIFGDSLPVITCANSKFRFSRVSETAAPEGIRPFHEMFIASAEIVISDGRDVFPVRGVATIHVHGFQWPAFQM
jgi:hypothetical protein